jgi:hypothetical protein
VSNNNSKAGIGFTGVLTIAFVVLKLTGVIAWSWWWVLSPVWIAAAAVILCLIFAFILMIVGVRK